MQRCLIVFFALWVQLQVRPTATVSGQVLDREGEPFAGVLITYTNAGTFDRNYRSDPGMRTESPRMLEGTGRVYKIKTNRKGAFLLVGVDYGVYDIAMIAPDGRLIYSGRKTIVDSSEASSQNVLNVDLSLVTNTPLVPGSGTNLAGGKKTKEQLALIHEENVHAVKINRLIAQYQNALAVQDWLGAIDLVQKLIVLDRNRWEFYQNLGRLQMNLMAYQEAAVSFGRGVEVAQKTLANPSDTDRALRSVGELLLSQADCDERLEKIDEAVALYEKAAAIHPHPFMAHYRACSVLYNHGKTDAAIEACTRAIADDPAQWLPYQALGGIFTTANKPEDALAAYEKGIAAAQNTLEVKSGAATTRAGLGQMLNSEGNLLLQRKRYDDAIVAFTKATGVSALPATPYFNLCATYYNLKRADEAIAACEQAIASDPTLSDAYYIKGAILFGRGQMANGRFVAPSGTLESLNQYLRYDPSGQYAATVTDMIDKLNGRN